ncbi:uncharacterized protein N7529_007003 [Penicillium soppii]|uniref:uncharacterized protein n=1 Tax=Penicillium soppii TaxID=69789 RepID=UPI002547E7DF|nr:uncharacterized protein N7529_007003 [Penicillium soppii]KAJ5865087.1 hypothetical protein N7529_007003 [Penicillium soppii]
MLKKAGWWDAWLQDQQTPRTSTRLDESDIWRMSRRFATECLLSGRKSNVERPGFLKTAVVDFSGLSDTAKKARGNRLQPVMQISESKGPGTSAFSVSNCSKYLLVTTGRMIYVYHLLSRKTRPISPDSSDADMTPISRILCPFDVVSATIDTSKSRFTIAALLHNRVGMICDLDMSQSTQPPTPIDPSSHHFFYNICTEDNPPRTIALCPGRPLVAFGCASGIEIHSTTSKRTDSRKHFTLPQPSEILHFLPSNPETPTELRLISSLSGPGLHECKCPPSPKPRFHFLADVQSFSRRRIPHAPSRSFVRATHCHHYRAVPINDGLHMMFIDPRSNLLCIGSDAPIGGPTSLTRAFVCIPPFGTDAMPPIPVAFAAASDLRWGLRIVAVYGNRLVLYSVPLDVFNVIRRERQRQLSGAMGDGDLARDWNVDPDNGREFLSVAYRATAMMWPFKVYGKVIGTVEDAVEVSVLGGEGGVRVWAFGGDGKGEIFDVDTGDLEGRRFEAREGGLVKVDGSKNSSLKCSLKRKRAAEDDGFGGRYGRGHLDVKPCSAGLHGHLDPGVRRSSFAACIIDFKIPDLGS